MEDSKAERRHFQRSCNAMNIIVCLLMGSCQGLMIYYQIPYYSTFMFTIQFFRRGVIMAWLLVLIGCNFCTKGFFRENFPLFSRRRTRHISYGFVFAAIGIFTVQDPLTLALYQGYRENVCLAKDDCDSRIPPEVMLYIIAGMSTICLSSFLLGFINAGIVWKYFNEPSDNGGDIGNADEEERAGANTSQNTSISTNSSRSKGNGRQTHEDIESTQYQIRFNSTPTRSPAESIHGSGGYRTFDMQVNDAKIKYRRLAADDTSNGLGQVYANILVMLNNDTYTPVRKVNILEYIEDLTSKVDLGAGAGGPSSKLMQPKDIESLVNRYLKLYKDVPN